MFVYGTYGLREQSDEAEAVCVCVWALTFVCAIACEQFSFDFIVRACIPL